MWVCPSVIPMGLSVGRNRFFSGRIAAPKMVQFTSRSNRNVPGRSLYLPPISVNVEIKGQNQGVEMTDSFWP